MMKLDILRENALFKLLIDTLSLGNNLTMTFSVKYFQYFEYIMLYINNEELLIFKEYPGAPKGNISAKIPH